MTTQAPTSPDISMMRASFQDVLFDVANRHIPSGKESTPEVLAHFDANRTDFDPFILQALGVEVACDELKPVSGHDTASHVRLDKVVAIEDLGEQVVVIQRSELDLGGVSKEGDHSYPLLMGRVVTYSAIAVSPEFYANKTGDQLETL